MNARSLTNKMIRPPALKKNDTIGLIAPSGPINSEILTQGLKILRDHNLKVSYRKDILERQHYLAGDDKRRLSEFHQIWSDPEVKAVLAVRGGFGSSRIIEQLDYDLIAKNPKILVGFSDLTIMLNAITQQTGLITFHGPMLSTLVRDQSNSPILFNQLSKLSQDPIKARPLEILRDGTAEGRLIGGNLTCFQHLAGGRFMPDVQDSILLLEDINEPAYKIDRTLTGLKQLGILDKFSGIILGQFLDSDLKQQSDFELIWQRVLELTGNIPVWADFPVGHGEKNLLMPIGVRVQMDSSAGIVRFLEASRSSGN